MTALIPSLLTCKSDLAPSAVYQIKRWSHQASIIKGSSSINLQEEHSPDQCPRYSRRRKQVMMHARNFFLGSTWLLSRLAAPVAAGLYPEDAVDRLAALGLDNLGRYLNQTSASTCTLETAVKRREWWDISIQVQVYLSLLITSYFAGAISASPSERITSKLFSASSHSQPGMTARRSQVPRADSMTSSRCTSTLQTKCMELFVQVFPAFPCPHLG